MHIKPKHDNINSTLHLRLREAATIASEKAAAFFKTGSGHYAEGDAFLGITVPTLRSIAKDYAYISLHEIANLIQSRFNEERLLALLILVHQYDKGTLQEKEAIYYFYLQNLPYVNNWNLVDASAHLIIGAHLWDKKRDLLFDLAQSPSMWKRRIAIVATWYFIRKQDLDCTFTLATLLLNDSHDLIHKAVGWMLREAGKRDEAQLILFLNQHAKKMPRTMLRYAIEKFPEAQRQEYLKLKRSLSYNQ